MKILKRKINQESYKKDVLGNSTELPNITNKKTRVLYHEFMSQINQFDIVLIDDNKDRIRSNNKRLKDYHILMKEVLNNKNYRLVIHKDTHIIYLYDINTSMIYNNNNIPHYNTINSLIKHFNKDYFKDIKLRLRKLKDFYFYFRNGKDIILNKNYQYYTNTLMIIKPLKIINNNGFGELNLQYMIYYPQTNNYYTTHERINMNKNYSLFGADVYHKTAYNEILDDNLKKEIRYITEKNDRAKEFMKLCLT